MARMDVQTSGRSGRPDAVLFGVSGVSSASSPGGAQSEGFPLEENQVVPRDRTDHVVGLGVWGQDLR